MSKEALSLFYTRSIANTVTNLIARMSSDTDSDSPCEQHHFESLTRPNCFGFSNILSDPQLFKAVISCMAARANSLGAKTIAGIGSQGYIFAAPVALELSLPLVLISKEGKTHGNVIKASYIKDYEEHHLEIEERSSLSSVVIIDFMLVTGATISCAAELVRKAGGSVAGAVVLFESEGLGGRAKLLDNNIQLDMFLTKSDSPSSDSLSSSVQTTGC